METASCDVSCSYGQHSQRPGRPSRRRNVYRDMALEVKLAGSVAKHASVYTAKARNYWSSISNLPHTFEGSSLIKPKDSFAFLIMIYFASLPTGHNVYLQITECFASKPNLR
jgi:hypothetical protein